MPIQNPPITDDPTLDLTLLETVNLVNSLEDKYNKLESDVNTTGTTITTENANAPATTTNSADADHVLINDNGTMKKITPADLGIGSGGGSGDITEVIAGTGLSGGATSGSATLSINSTVATLTGTQTLTNKSIDASQLTGTIDDARIPEATTSSPGLMPSSDKSKLNGIEGGADITDATNVAAAGALMDSEVTNLAQVKAFNSADYATAAQGTTADAALPKAGGQMTGNLTFSGSQTVDGRDVSADGAKLDGIENLADVTDATNVAAAGALMDSEVDADIKTLSLPANTTISAYGATLVDDADAAAARTTLGLGTAATTASTDYATAAQGTLASNALPKSGGAMTGAITTNSTFDGRDVGTDGTKLDGIEAGATADQTASEIKTAYESNADTNAFTDADHTKLNGIEASADVTDATNVAGAGALMDSEITNLAQVKAFDSSDYATAAQGSTADAALPKAGGQMTGNITFSGSQTVDGRDVSADGSKLDGIEASADVTDTTNVTAAGALMDSEVTNLAQVKAFNSADYATAAQGTTADAAMPKTGGTFTGDVTFLSTDAGAGAAPSLQLYRNSASPAANDDIGQIQFYGENDADEKIEYGRIDVKIREIGDGTEDGQLDLSVLRNSTSVVYQRMSYGLNGFYQPLYLGANMNIQFEGANYNNYETTLTVADPTADRTITLPNATGTVLTTGNSDTPTTTTSSSDADFVLIDDGGTMKKITPSNLGIGGGGGGSVAADDITTGNAAVSIATTSGNITLDAQGGDTDIIFKGTDNTTDITALTLDMSAAGKAIFNAGASFSDDVVVNSSGAAGSACLQLDNTDNSSNFAKSIEAYRSGIGTGQRHQFMLGKDGTNYDTATLNFYYAGSGSTSNRFEIGFWGADSLLNVIADGKVGIGTTSPATTLDVNGEITTSSGIALSQTSGVAIETTGTLSFADLTLLRASGATSGEYGFDIRYMGSRSGNLNSYSLFMHNQTGTEIEAMTVLQDGNVGIGTTSAATALDVNGDITTDELFVGNTTDHKIGKVNHTYGDGIGLTTDEGTVTIGQANASYTHYVNSNNVPHWFNQTVYTNGDFRFWSDTGALVWQDNRGTSHEVTLTTTTPTGAQTITLPDATGTVLTTGNSNTPTTTTSSSDADFVLIDDGGTMKKITPSNLGIGGGGGGVTPATGYFDAYLSSDQSLSSSFQDINYDVIRQNVGSAFSLSTGELTISVAGTYMVMFQVTIGNDGTSRSEGQVQLELKPSGGSFSTVAGSLCSTYNRNNAQDETTASASMILTIAANDTIQVVAKRNSGTGSLEARANGSRLNLFRIA